MSGSALSCICPPGFDPPFCTKSNAVLNVYCQVNVCRNGGTCIHTNDNTIASMKCLCLPGYSGVFCDTITVAFDQQDDSGGYKNLIPKVPSFCLGAGKTIDENKPFKVTSTPFSSNGFYIIQGTNLCLFKKLELLNFIN